MPSTYHSQQAAAGSVATRSQNNNRTPSLRSGDICVGCIVWLPPKTSSDDAVSCRRDGCCSYGVLQERGYNHPVVVLKIRQRENSSLYGDIMCTVVCVTTFQDTLLPEYLAQRHRRPQYRESIPILTPAMKSLFTPGFDNGKQLFLEKDELKKQSYVKLRHIYEIQASMLTQYSRNHCRAYKKRLSKASYVLLMEELGLLPEVFEETATLFETAGKRLFELANTVRVSQSASGIRSSTNNSESFVIPPVHQQYPIYTSQSEPQKPSCGATSAAETARLLPVAYQRTSPYSSTPEPVDGDSSLSIFKCILVIAVVVVGTFAWWWYSL